MTNKCSLGLAIKKAFGWNNCTLRSWGRWEETVLVPPPPCSSWNHHAWLCALLRWVYESTVFTAFVHVRRSAQYPPICPKLLEGGCSSTPPRHEQVFLAEKFTHRGHGRWLMQCSQISGFTFLPTCKWQDCLSGKELYTVTLEVMCIVGFWSFSGLGYMHVPNTVFIYCELSK